MIKKAFLFLLLLLLTLMMISCDEQSVAVNNISSSFISEAEACEVFTFDKEITENEKSMFYAAAYLLNDFYHVVPDSSRFHKTDIVDMGDYALLNIPVDFIYFQVKVTYEDYEVFFVNSELYSFTQFLNEEIDDYSYSSMNEYGMYKYEKDPINEEQAQAIVEEFILTTPLAQTKMTLKEITFEYKYDSSEKEFYVIKYSYINDKMIYDTVYFKLDTYMKKIVQITK